MTTINLKDFYYWYLSDELVEVPDEVAEELMGISGTFNRAGYLKVRAERVGRDSTLARMIRLVEEASPVSYTHLPAPF